MIVAIAGSRDYPTPEEVIAFLHGLASQFLDVMIVSGGRGIVDKTAETTAYNMFGMDVISLRPVEVGPEHFEIVCLAYGDRAAEHADARGLRTLSSKHSTFGQACYSRNVFIINEAERLVAFWDGQSRGTSNAIEIARSKPIPVSVKRPGMPIQLAA